MPWSDPLNEPACSEKIYSQLVRFLAELVSWKSGGFYTLYFSDEPEMRNTSAFGNLYQDGFVLIKNSTPPDNKDYSKRLGELFLFSKEYFPKLKQKSQKIFNIHCQFGGLAGQLIERRFERCPLRRKRRKGQAS
jgi:hypothetical protein